MPKLKPETLANRKIHILKAALVCFNNKGYHQTTMDDIVQEAGLSKGGLYVHFNGKKDLFLDLFDWFIDEFGLFSITTATGSTTYEKLTSILLNLVAGATSDTFRELSSLMTDVWAQNLRDQDFNQLINRLYVQIRQPLTQLIEEGIADGIFKPVDSKAFANILIAIFEGLMIQAMVDETAVNWTAISGTLNSIINGLLLEYRYLSPRALGDLRTQ